MSGVRVLAVLVLVLLSSNCSSNSYPVPPQHNPAAGPDPVTSAEYFRASDPDAESYIVKDVRGLEGGAYRWTSTNPEFRFQLRDIQQRRFRLEFVVHAVTLRDVGPLEITVEVNGRLLDHATFNKAGDATFERPVPEASLIANGENRVSVRIHNPWRDAVQGVDLGLVFRAAGFVE